MNIDLTLLFWPWPLRWVQSAYKCINFPNAESNSRLKLAALIWTTFLPGGTRNYTCTHVTFYKSPPPPPKIHNDNCFVSISTQHVFGRLRIISERVESNIQAGTEEYGAATLHAQISQCRKKAAVLWVSVHQWTGHIEAWEAERGNVLGRCFAELWGWAI